MQEDQEDEALQIVLLESQGYTNEAAKRLWAERNPNRSAAHLLTNLKAGSSPSTGLGTTQSNPIMLTDTPSSEASDMERALQLSLQQSHQHGPGSAGGVDRHDVTPMDIDNAGASQNEMDLNKAIEQSLMETRGDYTVMLPDTNPQWRKREEGVPVGLKNVGNTCYFNSMLQTYFMLPIVRKAVLAFSRHGDVSEEDPHASTLKFMKQLQKLFAKLMLSKQKYVDPTDLLKNTTKDGKSVIIGDQQDVADFNDLFLRSIAKGFEIDSEQNKPTAELMKNMFSGQAEEHLVVEGKDGDVETSQPTEFTSLILPIGEESSTLFDRLDAYVLHEVLDYKSDSGSAKASSCFWLKDLPSMLMLQQSRVQFDIDTKSFVKRETPVLFEKEISVDRYMIENKDEITRRRGIVANWKVELAQLEAELCSYTHYKGRSHGLDDALTSVIDYCKDKSEKTQDTSYLPMMHKLMESLKIERGTMNVLEAQVSKLRSRIDTAYQDMQKYQYSLYAVWIHQGVAGSGHFWANVRSSTDKWVKFNDLRVSWTDEQTVMKEAVGGYNSTSAYFLIYIKKDIFEQMNMDFENLSNVDELPNRLRGEVEQDNEQFKIELEEYEKKKMDKFELFVVKYREAVQAAEKHSREISPERDERIHSYLTFLDSVGQHGLMLAEAVREKYKEVFDRLLEKDVGFDIYGKLETVVGSEILVEATRIGLEETTKDLTAEYHLFQKMMHYLTNGIRASNNKKFLDALVQFVSAFDINCKLQHEQTKKTEDIEAAVSFCVREMIKDAGSKYGTGEFSSAMSLLRSASNTLNWIFASNKNHPQYRARVEEFTSLVSSLRNAPPEHQDSLFDILDQFESDEAPQLPYLNATLEQLNPAGYLQLSTQYTDEVKRMLAAAE